MKKMSAEKIQKFLDYLDLQIEKSEKNRDKVSSEGNYEVAYYCKLELKQTEKIRQKFVEILNE